MRKLLYILIPACLMGCKGETKPDASPAKPATEVSEGATADMTPSEKMGREIFDGKGLCNTCHKPDQKIVGPGVSEIARVYKEKNGDIVAFLKGEAGPLVDPSQYEVMKANITVTKNYPDEELKALQDYMMSFTNK